MIPDRDTSSHHENIPDDVLAAVAIIQLGVLRSPDDSSVIEVAADHSDDRHRHVTDLLRGVNRAEVHESILVRLSSLIHLSCEWAWHYRHSRKTSITRTKAGWKVRSHLRSSSSGRDLRRLAEVSRGNDAVAIARAIVDLSPHTFAEIRQAAKKIGIKFVGPASLLCGECTLRASSLALTNLNSGRPRLREMDRAARAVKLAYQTVTGRTGSGRGTVSSASYEAGKPTGELHSLLLRVGELYGIKLVTPASDDRLRSR